MRRLGLQGAVRGRSAKTTTPAGDAERPADRVNRDFTVSRPDARWVSDLTPVSTGAGFGGVHHRWTKTELIVRRGPWRGLEAVEFATLEWVHWHNHRRLLGPIGYIPPAQKEHTTSANDSSRPSRPDSSKSLSGIPGAVQRYRRRRHEAASFR